MRTHNDPTRTYKDPQGLKTHQDSHKAVTRPKTTADPQETHKPRIRAPAKAWGTEKSPQKQQKRQKTQGLGNIWTSNMRETYGFSSFRRFRMLRPNKINKKHKVFERFGPKSSGFSDVFTVRSHEATSPTRPTRPTRTTTSLPKARNLQAHKKPTRDPQGHLRLSCDSSNSSGLPFEQVLSELNSDRHIYMCVERERERQLFVGLD